MNLNGFVSHMFMKFQLRVKFDTKIVVDGKNRERTAFNRAAIRSMLSPKNRVILHLLTFRSNRLASHHDNTASSDAMLPSLPFLFIPVFSRLIFKFICTFKIFFIKFRCFY